MYETTLLKTGLDFTEASVYETLLKTGPITAGKLTKETPFKRGLVYKTLDDLEVKGLVTKEDRGDQPMLFHPAHPLKLKDLANQREQEIRDAKLALEGTLPQLASEYNLSVGKPGVQFFEGKDGVKKVLADSLTAQSTIYSYTDIEAIVTHIKEMNEWYVKEREKREIKKKGLLIDTPFARKYLQNYHQDITDTKLFKTEATNFESIMQIYDQKISYVTLGKKSMIGVIIENKAIYEIHKYIFEYIWKLTPTLQETLSGKSGNTTF
ncbi:MAG TPA: helix-turn-helix domain-containing protein [Candidatus Paceibacterota bacterium]|nr:helix-turn-helix domain-containing protein [Candidatus Paceibacterota bacterium]